MKLTFVGKNRQAFRRTLPFKLIQFIYKFLLLLRDGLYILRIRLSKTEPQGAKILTHCLRVKLLVEKTFHKCRCQAGRSSAGT